MIGERFAGPGGWDEGAHDSSGGGRMTAPPSPLAGARAWLARCAAVADGNVSTHANTVTAWINQAETDIADLRRRVVAAERIAVRVDRAETVITAVHNALDSADPHDPDALAHLARTIGDLLQVTPEPVPR